MAETLDPRPLDRTDVLAEPDRQRAAPVGLGRGRNAIAGSLPAGRPPVNRDLNPANALPGSDPTPRWLPNRFNGSRHRRDSRQPTGGVTGPRDGRRVRHKGDEIPVSNAEPKSIQHWFQLLGPMTGPTLYGWPERIPKSRSRSESAYGT